MAEGAARVTDASEAEELLLCRLTPPGAPVSVADHISEMGLWQRPLAGAADRPRVLLNMVSTVDGRATLDGRSGTMSGRADRVLFHALRNASDAVLVGAGTVRKERYGRLIRDEARRRSRVQHGLAEEPLACIVSARLELDPTIPLLASRQSRVVVLTPSGEQLADSEAHVDYVRSTRGSHLDLGAALRTLRERFAVQLLLCEGGPHLASQLLSEGLLDELFVSISPLLAGEDGASARGAAPLQASEPLRILAGIEFDPAARLQLRAALEHESHLFLRYGVAAPERVSRETMLSSSPAR